ncbi:uncharacterized protein LOC34621496 [Cyclospora cayetanensis]|uniref:Ferrochelatase n=1 Tax=Cyclospora cayetanensis TaxID=88456 RepID=A0A6P6RYP6_9EIME|nr:uncharacterized protein LOC34621496 [Cyclospora cayetanensis]
MRLTRLAGMLSTKARAVFASCIHSPSSCDSTIICRAGCSSKSSFGGERRCSSSAAARAAADTWRGTHNQKQHHKQRQEQLQKINNKEQQLLSPSAANWQQLWHHSNSHAPKFSEARCNSSRDCNNSSRSTNVVHVVLLNLGSPAEPTYTALWMYLRRTSAARYSKIWLSQEAVKEQLAPAAAALQERQQQHREQEQSLLQRQLQGVLQGGSASPLLVHHLSLAARLQKQLDLQQQQGIPRFEVAACMRYGSPDVASVLQQLRQQHQQLKLLLLPLYPQSTASCTASAFDEVFSELKRWRVMPDLRMVAGYSKHERYIDAIAALVKKFWEQNGRGDHLLFSYHSIPLDMSRSAGDPYACLCFQTSRLVAEKLDLQPEEYEVAMQSRTGCSAWAEPYLIPALEALAKAGCLQVDVVLPGFAADCLETLEEIQQEAAAHFKAVTDGRGELRVVPCLNDSDEAVNLIESLVLENTQQWWRQPA